MQLRVAADETMSRQRRRHAGVHAARAGARRGGRRARRCLRARRDALQGARRRARRTSATSAQDVLEQVKARAAGRRCASASPVRRRISSRSSSKAMAREPARSLRERRRARRRISSGSRPVSSSRAHRYTRAPAGVAVAAALPARGRDRRGRASSCSRSSARSACAGSSPRSGRPRRRARRALLEERGRTELLAGRAGRALAYLVGAARDGAISGARGFLIAEAMRPFLAPSSRAVGAGPVRSRSAADGELVATGGGDGVELWTADARSCDARAIARLRALAFDPSGALGRRRADDGTGVDLVGRRGASVERTARGAILDVAFSADGRRLVTGEQRWHRARVGRRRPRPRSRSTRAHTGRCVSARFSPDGATRRDRRATTRLRACGASSDGAPAAPLRGHIAAVDQRDRWSGDGSLRRHGERRWHRVRVERRARQAAGDSRCVTIRARRDRRRDARRTIAVVARPASTDHVARVWELPSDRIGTAVGRVGASGATLVGHTDAIVARRARSDGDSASRRPASIGSRRCGTPTSGQLLASFEHDAVVAAVAFAGDATRLVTGERRRRARVWDTAPACSRRRHDARCRRSTRSPSRPMARSRPVPTTAACGCGTATTGADLRGHLGRVLAVALSPDGKRLVTRRRRSARRSCGTSRPGAHSRCSASTPSARATALAIAGDRDRHGSTPTACSSGRSTARGSRRSAIDRDDPRGRPQPRWRRSSWAARATDDRRLGCRAAPRVRSGGVDVGVTRSRSRRDDGRARSRGRRAVRRSTASSTRDRAQPVTLEGPFGDVARGGVSRTMARA